MRKLFAALARAVGQRKTALAFAGLLSSSALIGTAIGPAIAMPAGPAATPAQRSGALQDVRWVCGPYRCWWRPGSYYERPYWRGYWGAYPYYWHYRWY